MAIQKMKKLRLMVVRSQKKELMDELTRLACVQIVETEELPEGLSKEAAALSEAKALQSTLSSALKVLDKEIPAKKKLLSPKPEIGIEEFMEGEGFDGMPELAGEVLRLDQRQRSISGEESRLRALIEAMLPWRTLDMPLETLGTKNAAVFLGTLPAASAPEAASAVLEEKAPEAELFVISADEDRFYVLLLCSKSMSEEALEPLREFGFARMSAEFGSGTAEENILRSEKALEDLAAERVDIQKRLTGIAESRDELKLCADRADTAVSRAENEARLFGSESTVCFTGWLPEEEELRFAESMEKFTCAWETCDPVPEEYPDVPVQLKNNKVTNALNMVTNMYSLPAYDGVDPNPLMAPFFILFFGLMMADMGYGALMIIAAVVALKKIKPREGTLSFCQLLLYGGISTFIMGALTGGLFGNALEIVGQILGKPEGWGVLPALFSPMNNSMAVMIGALALGLVHLNTGMAVSFVQKCRRGEYADAFWGEGVMWITLLGAILLGVSILKETAGTVGKVVLILGIVGVLYGGSRSSEGVFGKILSVFVTVYNEATGWFGDILSYIRIMALMLAGSVIAMVFNIIGSITGNLLGFLVIFLIGHTLNFALNLLGCYVHDLRLQCLEYFGKFYKDGGKPFRPVKVQSQYYDVTE